MFYETKNFDKQIFNLIIIFDKPQRENFLLINIRIPYNYVIFDVTCLFQTDILQEERETWRV